MQVGSHNRSRDRCEMRVVCEKQYLRGSCQLGQHAEACLRALVVEIHEQIVGEEGQPDPGSDRLFYCREAQRKKELVGRALAHRADLDHRSPIVPEAQQPRGGTIRIDLERRVAPDRQLREKRAGAQ